MKEEITPMEFRSGKETLLNIPNRIITLVWKVIGWKGVFVALTVILIYHEKLPDGSIPYVWIALMLIAVFGEKALDVIKDIKK